MSDDRFDNLRYYNEDTFTVQVRKLEDMAGQHPPLLVQVYS